MSNVGSIFVKANTIDGKVKIFNDNNLPITKPAINWTPAKINTVAWYDASDESSMYGSFLTGQIGVLDVSTTNPETGEQWRAGDTYRLAFVTSGMANPTSGIDAYNDFVNAEAAISTYANLSSVQWKAIVSTTTIDARDNTSTNPNTNGSGEPIILIDGSTVVNNNYNDLWVSSGDPAPLSRIDRDQNNNARSKTDMAVFGGFGGTWTGTQNDGTAENPLSGSGPYNFGIFGAEFKFWVDRGSNAGTGLCPIYALSEVLTVSAGSGNISQWDDKSGNGYHAIQDTGSRQPVTNNNTINNLNVIEGIDRNQNMVITSNPSIKTFFCVCQTVSLGTSYLIVMGRESDNDPEVFVREAQISFDGGGTNTGKYRLDGGTISSEAQDHSVSLGDNTPHVIEGVSTASFSLQNILGRPGSAIGPDGNQRLGELIWLDNEPDTATRQKIEGYLAWKWGLEGNLPSDHPYKNRAPLTT